MGHAIVRETDGGWEVAYVAFVVADLDAAVGCVPDGWAVDVVGVRRRERRGPVRRGGGTLWPGPVNPGWTF